MKYHKNCQNATETPSEPVFLEKMALNKLARHNVDKNLQYVKATISAKCNKVKHSKKEVCL